MFILGFKMLIH